MNKILKIISNILLTTIIIILSIYAILRFTNKMGIYKVMTGSMETGIHRGDYIFVTKTNNYKKRDIITYKNNNYYITHRIVRIEGDYIITKGDANNVEDEKISKDVIVGKFIYKSKILNYIFDYKIVIIISTILLYIISNILDKKNKNEENILKEEEPK